MENIENVPKIVKGREVECVHVFEFEGELFEKRRKTQDIEMNKIENRKC